MMKKLELSYSDSCWNKADENEIVFIILSRDEAAQSAIEHWCKMRVHLGKNKASDKKIIDALACAKAMEIQRKAKVIAKELK